MPNDEFDLYSVPSYSIYTPDRVHGAEIGSTKQEVEPADVLLCKIVPHIRRSWVVPPCSNRKQIASGEWIVFRNHPLEPEFLRRFVLSDGFHEQFMLTVAGVGGSLMRARPVDAAKISIPVPPQAEQRRIVAKLDTLTARFARARKELDRVQSLADRQRGTAIRATLRDLFALHGDVPASDLFSWSSGKFLPKKAQNGGSIPVYGGNGINGWHDQANVETPTIVVGRVGAQCGNVHIISEAAWVTDNAIYARAVSSSVDLHFAFYVFDDADLIQHAAGTGQPYVNQDTLNELRFPKVSLEAQRAVGARFKSIFARANRLEAEAARARALIDRLESAILAKAFRGELLPQDPNDEPASVLLDRIRTQRAADSKPKRGRRAASGHTA